MNRLSRPLRSSLRREVRQGRRASSDASVILLPGKARPSSLEPRHKPTWKVLLCCNFTTAELMIILVCQIEMMSAWHKPLTSSRSDLDILKPSSWLITRLHLDLLLRPLTICRDEAEAGKQNVAFFYTKTSRQTATLFRTVSGTGVEQQATQAYHVQYDTTVWWGVVWPRSPERTSPDWHCTSCGRPSRPLSYLRDGGSSECEL